MGPWTIAANLDYVDSWAAPAERLQVAMRLHRLKLKFQEERISSTIEISFIMKID